MQAVKSARSKDVKQAGRVSVKTRTLQNKLSQPEF